VTIRGLTFTGELVKDLTWGSASVILSNPGSHNVRFVDCTRKDLYAPSDMIHVGLNGFQLVQGDFDLPRQSMDLAIINSTFQNIAYEVGLMRTFHQGMSLDGVQFTNIKLPPFVRECFFKPECCQDVIGHDSLSSPLAASCKTLTSVCLLVAKWPQMR